MSFDMTMQNQHMVKSKIVLMDTDIVSLYSQKQIIFKKILKLDLILQTIRQNIA